MLNKYKFLFDSLHNLQSLFLKLSEALQIDHLANKFELPIEETLEKEDSAWSTGMLYNVF